MPLEFENTETAFAYKNNRELRNARFLFKTMSRGWIVRLGIWLTPRLLRMNFPVQKIIKNTIFRQFVGGETLEQTKLVEEKLADFNVKIILDYGVERKMGEENYDHARDEFIKVLNFASERENVPFISVKITGLARISLLEKLNSVITYEEVVEGKLRVDMLDDVEKEEWGRVYGRLTDICTIAFEKRIGVMVDAEETWIRGTIDALTTQMMERFNKRDPLVYNTAQLYRHDRLQYIRELNEYAHKKRFKLALKLVRGAYMEKERERALSKRYPSPVNPDKESTDKLYNEALRYCIDPINDIYTLVGSHNEYSNLLATEQIQQNILPKNTSKVFFSQLYGMSDGITFNLAKEGYNATKYLPFGPIKDVIPYLMRRAEENSSLGGQTGRELDLIEKELKRRKKK